MIPAKSAVEAAAVIRDRMKGDSDLSRSVAVMVERAGHTDVYSWCDAHPDYAIALANQLGDIDSQVANMQARLDRGELT